MTEEGKREPFDQEAIDELFDDLHAILKNRLSKVVYVNPYSFDRKLLIYEMWVLPDPKLRIHSVEWRDYFEDNARLCRLIQSKLKYSEAIVLQSRPAELTQTSPIMYYIYVRWGNKEKKK